MPGGDITAALFRSVRSKTQSSSAVQLSSKPREASPYLRIDKLLQEMDVVEARNRIELESPE